jgi:hypothetical protein
VRWLQANITGACNVECVLERRADITLLTEVRCSGKALAKECKRRNLVCTGRDSDMERLAAVVYDPKIACEIKAELTKWPHWEARVAGIRVKVGPRVSAVVWVVYGFDCPSATELAELQAVLQSLVAQARSGGDVPVVVAGDINATFEGCSFFTNLARDGWRDLGNLPTCIAGTTKLGRRIDLTVANQAYADCVQGYRTHWETGLPTHAVQEWSTDRSRSAPVLSYEISKGLGEEPEFCEGLWRRSWFVHGGKVQRAFDADDLDTGWALLEECITKAYGEKAAQPRARITLKEPHPNMTWKGDAVTMELSLSARRRRRLQQLRCMVGIPERSYVVGQILKKIRNDPDPGWAHWGEETPTIETLDALIQKAQEEEDRAVCAVRKERCDSFQKWANADTKGSLKQVCRWMREGPRLPSEYGLYTAADGEVLSGEAGLIRAVDEAWWPLWKPAEKRQTREPKFTAYGSGDMPVLTAAMLRAACKAIGLDKSPGEDGWTARLMDEWSAEAWDQVCELLRAVERTGKWPKQLSGGIVCMLAKGGVGPSVADPLQARPVVLLSVLYRVWAKARAGYLEHWIRVAGMQPLEESAASCEDLAVDLAFVLEAAKVGGALPAWAVATDLSKAYDRIPLDVLEAALRDSGLPFGLWGPLLAMARSARRIKVGSVCGKQENPTHGLVPGCPLATYVMGLLLHRWRLAIYRAVPQAVKRSWVDDSTASATGDALVGLKLVLANTVAFEDLQATDEALVNVAKSGYLASHPKEAELVERVLEARMLWPLGGVQIIGEAGPGEPDWVGTAPMVERADDLSREAALVAAARASVIVVGNGKTLHPNAWDVAAITGCVICLGAWQDMSEQVQASVERQLARHGQEKRARMILRLTLKDLGVAQGLGKEAKEGAAKRHTTLQQRALAISTLPVSGAKAERLVAISGIPAGLYGAAARPPDADTLACMRKWVMHACYKGSRFAQSSLWFVLCADTWRSDPVKVWMVKAAEACARQARNYGLDLLQRVWEAKGKNGPVAGLQAVLLAAGVEATLEEWVADGLTLRDPLLSSAADRKAFILGAVQAADLRRAAARRGQSLLAQVDVQEARRVLKAVSDPARRGALRSVFTGDCVVRSMTKKWQGHDGKCACGLEAETRGHVFWECPITKCCRSSQEAGTSHQLRAPEGLERELGLPLKVPEVEAWREAWTAPPQEPAAVWKAEHLYVDASCKQPKLSSIRTVGWAVVDGKGHTRGGVLPPGSTVALGESRAIIEAYAHCEANSVIWSDCQAAVKLWRSCQRPSAKRYAGALLEVLPAFAEAKRRLPGVQVFWVPSHLTCAEFEAKGHPRHAWCGNNAADEAAKLRARLAIAPDELVARVQAQRARAKEVAQVVVSAQLQRLQQRIRTEGGAAVKARKRRAPAGLRRLRAAGEKKVCRRAEVVPGRSLRDLLMPGIRANTTAEEASGMMDAAVATVGFHDLWPIGPWPTPGTCIPKDGRLVWPWVCRSCNKGANDTSRVTELARKPCGLQAWVSTREVHEVVQLGVDSYGCTRCGRTGDSAHRIALEGSMCTVPRVSRAGTDWAEGAQAIAGLLGRVAAFRRWAEPDPGLRSADVQMPQAAPQPLAAAGSAGSSGPAAGPFGGLLAGYRSHLCVAVSRKTVCCACYQVARGGYLETFRNSHCPGALPVEGVPPFLRDGIRRLGVVAASSAGLERCKVLADGVGGNRALLRCSAKVPVGGGGLPAAGSHQVSAIAAALMAVGRVGAGLPG